MATRAKLTAQDVVDIRTLVAMDVPRDRIADRYQVSKSAVSRAANAVSFKNIVDVSRTGEMVIITKAVREHA